MTRETVGTREAISALADGQLRGREFARAVETVSLDEDARATWHAYHLVGDVLRAGSSVPSHRDRDFVARFQVRLKAEMAVELPQVTPVLIAENSINKRADIAFDHTVLSANAANFRWKLLAGVASVAAVAAVSWILVGTVNPVTPATLAGLPSTPAAVAQSSNQAVAVATEPAQVMIRDARLDELLAAHKQFGGTSALQMPNGFLRNATFDGAER